MVNYLLLQGLWTLEENRNAASFLNQYNFWLHYCGAALKLRRGWSMPIAPRFSHPESSRSLALPLHSALPKCQKIPGVRFTRVLTCVRQGTSQLINSCISTVTGTDCCLSERCYILEWTSYDHLRFFSLTPCYPWSARDVLIPVDDIPPQGPNWSLLLVYNYLLSSTSQIKELSTNIASPVSFNCATHSHSGTLPWPPFPLPTTLGWSRAWGQHILITYLYSLRKVLLSQLVLLLFYFFEESSWLKQLKEERVWFVQGLNFQRLDG